MVVSSYLKGKGNVFYMATNLYKYTARISDIYVDGLYIISVKINFEKLPVITYLLSVDAR